MSKQHSQSRAWYAALSVWGVTGQMQQRSPMLPPQTSRPSYHEWVISAALEMSEKEGTSSHLPPPLLGGWHLAGSDSERRKGRHAAEGSAAAFWFSDLYASFLPPLYSLPAASYIFMVVTATDSISSAMCSSAHANNSYRSLLSNPTNFTAPWQNSREGQLQRSINKEHENL